MSSSRAVFERFVPERAVTYCVKLLEYFGFEFKIKKSRATKLGDYRYSPKTKVHTITINNDLNNYAFLVTYLHEVAHMATFKDYGRKAAPHGTEWKNYFKRIAEPVLNDEVFPPQVLGALQNYFKNPKAASCSDPILFQVLKHFDEPDGQIALGKLQPGMKFIFQGKEYVKLEKRRTRCVCVETSSQRKYLIAEVASVLPINNDLPNKSSV